MRGHARTARTVSCGAGGTQAPWLLWEIWEGGDEPAGAQDRQRLLRLRGEGRGEGEKCCRNLCNLVCVASRARRKRGGDED